MISDSEQFGHRMWAALWTWLNRIGAIVGILGTAFAIYTYRSSLPFRQLTFYADPASALIVKSGETSKLVVTYEGQPISTDVIAAQVVLWNAGKLPIKPEHVRETIVLKTDPPCPILEPTIRASTPDREKIIDAQIDKSEAAAGRIKLSWGILEQDDGFRIQLIFAGPSITRLVPSGVIEGQKHIAIVSDEQQDWFVRLMLRSLIGLAIGLAFLMPVTLFFPWGRSKDRSVPTPKWFNVVMRTVVAVALIIGISAMLRGLAVRPGLMPQSLMTSGQNEKLQNK